MSEKRQLEEALGLLRRVVEAISTSSDRACESEVIELLGAASDVSRAADGLRVAVTGMVSRRSEGYSRAEALCARLGFRSTKALIGQAFGVHAGNAETLLSLAQATGARTGFSSGELEPFRPALAAALRAGEISADQAIAVHRGLPHPGGPESQPGLGAAAERFLVDGATGGRVSFDDVGRAVVIHGDPSSGVAGVAGAAGDAAGGSPDGRGPGTSPSGTPAAGSAQGSARGGGDATGAADGGFWNIPGVTPAGGTTSVGTRRRTGADVDVWGPRRMEPHLVRVQAGAWRNAIDPDGVAPREGEQVRRRSFSARRATGGGWNLSGYAPELAGATLAAFLDAHTGPQAHPDRFLDPTGGHSGPAELPERSAAGWGREAPEEGDGRTAEQKGFDALYSLVEGQLRRQDEAGPGCSGATLVVTVTMSALDRFARSLGDQGNAAMLPGLDAWSGATPHCPAPGGVEHGTESAAGWAGTEATLDAAFARHSRSDEVVPLSTVTAMLCTDALRLLVTDEAGTAVRMGRQQRPFTRAQRQALAARDRHCRAPGCLAPPAWCHTHHVIPWSVGGPTNLDNAILLCSFHHHELHRGRLGVVPAAELGQANHPWAVLSSWHLRTLAAQRGQANVEAPPRRLEQPTARGGTCALNCSGPVYSLVLPDASGAEVCAPQGGGDPPRGRCRSRGVPVGSDACSGEARRSTCAWMRTAYTWSGTARSPRPLGGAGCARSSWTCRSGPAGGRPDGSGRSWPPSSPASTLTAPRVTARSSPGSTRIWIGRPRITCGSSRRIRGVP
ncbi:MAG: HNH endonuclease [Arthrobacter sp.]|nr:HNH endonuclease [Arthrobacter sp.]